MPESGQSASEMRDQHRKDANELAEHESTEAFRAYQQKRFEVEATKIPYNNVRGEEIIRAANLADAKRYDHSSHRDRVDEARSKLEAHIVESKEIVTENLDEFLAEAQGMAEAEGVVIKSKESEADRS